jgi:hypothetical protein
MQPGNSQAVSPDNLNFVKYEYGMDQHDQPTGIIQNRWFYTTILRISKNHQLMLPKLGQSWSIPFQGILSIETQHLTGAK